jgi:hypothetical protein
VYSLWKEKSADKIVLNYKNEVPEYNLRNNWKSLKSFFPNNRPIKFVFMKDLEDPYYNQALYVPTLSYNLYDGLSPGMRLHNKTILDKPFIFDINPLIQQMQKHSQDLVSLSSIKIIEIVPCTTLLPFLALFPLCSRCCLFENQSDGAAKH